MKRHIFDYVPLPDVLARMGEVTIGEEATKRKLGFGSLLTTGNPKIDKSNSKEGYHSAIMHLAPGRTMCQWASKGCLAGCLNRAGVPFQLKGKLAARRKRTDLFANDPARFLAQLIGEIRKHVRQAEKLGRKPTVRLNGTSDVPWERLCPWLFTMFPSVQFYDYTKGLHRIGRTPSNYHLTLSRSEENSFEVGVALARGHQVAVVAEPAAWGKKWNGYATCSGETDDLIFKRPALVQLLIPKGPAKADTSGFVVRSA